MPPKGPVTIAKNSHAGTGGVIPVNPANLQTAPTKAATRLKLQIRRLPPGLTKDEFEQVFGEEWKVGNGKVDWMEYRQGKMKSPGKHPEQSVAYIHLTSPGQVKFYEAKFLSITFQDAKGTYKDPSVKHLAPMLEFAAIQRIPSPKQRVDGRQGTIDQDPEYMSFLEGETQPVTKPTSLDNGFTEKTKTNVTSTPLIDALREKKANKEKAKAAKAKRDDGKEDKPAEKPANVKGSKQADTKIASKPEPPVKGAIKATTKAQPAKGNAPVSAQNGTPAPPASSTAASKKRERAPLNAKSLLQRDLGLGQSPRRGAKTDAVSVNGAAATTQPASIGSTNGTPAKNSRSPKKARDTPSRERVVAETAQVMPAKNAPAPAGILKKDGMPANGVRGGRGGRLVAEPVTPAVPSQSSTAVSSTQPNAPASATARPKQQRPAPQPAPGATKAYLKHTNASQGITEQLILAALSEFGEVVSVEIDKRKGTALADFKSHEALKAAMARRSVPIAQGAVEVLEYRDKPTLAPTVSNRGGSVAGRGGSMRGRGRGGAARGALPNTTPSATAAPTNIASVPAPTSGGAT